MSELTDKIVSAADSWIGTRWQHQGAIKGVGVDCANFISEVARESGVKDVEIPKNYRPREDGTAMLRLLKDHLEMVPTEEMQEGDILALCDEAAREPDIPRHLAFVRKVTNSTVFIIHASQHGVRSHRIDAAWRRRIHSVWRVVE